MTDLSDGNEHIYRYALKLAHKLSANLIVLHVAEDMGINHMELSKKMEDLTLHLREESQHEKEGGIEISGVIERGVFPFGVKEVIDRFKVNLILMGAADGKNESGFLFGNKVRRIIDNIKYPILFIPEQVAFKDIKQIIYVTDIRYSDYKIIERLVAMVLPLNIEVSLLHVCTEGLPEIDTETVVSLFSDTIASRIKQPIHLYRNSKDCAAETTISQLLNSQSQTILALAHRKHHFFNHLFTDKPAKEATIYKHMPLLLMPV